MADLSLVFDIVAKDRASKDFKKVGDAVDDTGKKASKFGPAMAAGATAAGAAIVGFATSSVKAFVESEQSSVRLDEALKKFPKTNDVTRASFDTLNASLAAKTRFDDDATASGQAVLAQFGLTGKEIQQLTPLLQDYAAKTGKDLPDAANTLGKALLGKGKALSEVGIQFKDAGSVGKNFDQITAGLRKQVGGFAETEGKTAAGQAQILGNRFGEVQEKVGSKLTPALTDLANKLIEVIDYVERNQNVIVPLVAAVGTLAAGVLAVNAAAKAYTAVQTALNIVLAANPVLLVVTAVALLATGLVIAYKNSETFRNVVKAAFLKVSEVALGAIDGILAALGGIFGALAKIPGPFQDNFKKAANAINGAGDKVDQLQAKINALQSKQVTIEVTTIERRYEAGQGPLGRREHGGPVRAGHAYIVGEKRPEVFVPNQSGTILPSIESLSGVGNGSGLGGGLSQEVAGLRADVRGLVSQHQLALRAGY